MINIIHVKKMPIFEQLKLEEALLRTCNKNYCIINEGSAPAIVMGISGKQEELVHSDSPLPLIRRFSGGGTVVVDQNTLFISFIFQKKSHDFIPYPEPIHRWAETLYKEVFPENFALRENDYVFDDKKFGGNAQYIKKDRWLHHTTFLWDYNPQTMTHLLQPKKAPNYRNKRPHDDFLCKLKEHTTSKETLITKLLNALSKRHEIRTLKALPTTFPTHRSATHLVNPIKRNTHS